MRINIQRLPAQLPFCRLRAGCDTPQHQTNKQRQAISFPSACLHSRKVYKPVSEFERQLLSRKLIRDLKDDASELPFGCGWRNLLIDEVPVVLGRRIGFENDGKVSL